MMTDASQFLPYHPYNNTNMKDWSPAPVKRTIDLESSDGAPPQIQVQFPVITVRRRVIFPCLYGLSTTTQSQQTTTPAQQQSSCTPQLFKNLPAITEDPLREMRAANGDDVSTASSASSFSVLIKSKEDHIACRGLALKDIAITAKIRKNSTTTTTTTTTTTDNSEKVPPSPTSRRMAVSSSSESPRARSASPLRSPRKSTTTATTTSSEAAAAAAAAASPRSILPQRPIPVVTPTQQQQPQPQPQPSIRPAPPPPQVPSMSESSTKASPRCTLQPRPGLRTQTFKQQHYRSSSAGKQALASILRTPGKFASSSSPSPSSSCQSSAGQEDVKVEVQREPEPAVLEKPSEVTKISSIDSDIPSLASSSHSSMDDLPSSPAYLPGPIRLRLRSVSEPCRTKSVCFSPQVCVREFCRGPNEHDRIWYKEHDFERFRWQVMERIRKYTEITMIPTGTGRLVQKRPPSATTSVIVSPFRKDSKGRTSLMFSHCALQASDSPDDDEVEASEYGRPARDAKYIRAVKEIELRNVLVVDPHDLCRKLFCKAIKLLLPHAKIFTASSSREALQHVMNNRRFDMIVVEERLGLFHRQDKIPSCCSSSSSSAATSNTTALHHQSGAALLQELVKLSDPNKKSLLVGVSAHYKEDCGRLQAGGADITWSKPPPPMNDQLGDQILKMILLKRGRESVAEELFGRSALS